MTQPQPLTPEPTPPPVMTDAVRCELFEGLDELDDAFGGKPTAESVNARAWLEAYQEWQDANGR